MQFSWLLVLLSLVLPCCVYKVHAQAPAEAGLASPASDYRVGSGDVLHVSVWGQDQFTRDAVVRPDGKITLPLIPDFLAAGSTVTHIQTLLSSELARFVKNPLVTVSVVEAKSKVIYVTGEVLRPGAYLLTAPTTSLQLLVRAGGPTDFAKLPKAYVLRSSGERVPVNLKNLLKGKKLDSNVSLAAGDTVVVP